MISKDGMYILNIDVMIVIIMECTIHVTIVSHMSELEIISEKWV